MKKLIAACVVMGFIAGIAQANILNNGDFESGAFVLDKVPDGWTAWYSAGASPNANWKSGAGAHGGTKYAQLMGWSTGDWASLIQNVPVTPGNQYSFSLWARGNGSADNGAGSLDFLDAGGVSIDTAYVSYQFMPGAVWAFQDFGSFTAPAGAVSVDVGIWADSDVGSGGVESVLYYDDVVLTEAVPEPASMVLLGVGGLVTLMVLRRRKA